jgi:hypothetical protein
MVRVHAVTLLDVGIAQMFANQALNRGPREKRAPAV